MPGRVTSPSRTTLWEQHGSAPLLLPQACPLDKHLYISVTRHVTGQTRVPADQPAIPCPHSTPQLRNAGYGLVFMHRPAEPPHH